MALMPLDVLLAAAVDPHPELVSAQRVTPAQMCEAAAVLGWCPQDDARLFRPAVSA